uniref:Uncharacterized protein n=1 Tax=Arundo donax TaxID=35708 RepID=A0A0A9BE53_ARUDO
MVVSMNSIRPPDAQQKILLLHQEHLQLPRTVRLIV